MSISYPIFITRETHIKYEYRQYLCFAGSPDPHCHWDSVPSVKLFFIINPVNITFLN
jgi:hypothetical protein